MGNRLGLSQKGIWRACGVGRVGIIPILMGMALHGKLGPRGSQFAFWGPSLAGPYGLREKFGGSGAEVDLGWRRTGTLF